MTHQPNKWRRYDLPNVLTWSDLSVAMKWPCDWGNQHPLTILHHRVPSDDHPISGRSRSPSHLWPRTASSNTGWLDEWIFSQVHGKTRKNPVDVHGISWNPLLIRTTQPGGAPGLTSQVPVGFSCGGSKGAQIPEHEVLNYWTLGLPNSCSQLKLCFECLLRIW